MTSDDLEARVVELERRMKLVEDEHAIRELLAKYGFAADTCKDEEWVALFTDDGTMDLTMGNVESYSGHRRWTGHDELRQFIGNPEVHHHPDSYGRAMHVSGNNLVIDIHGDEAICESYSLNIRKDPGGPGFVVFDAANNHWKLRRENGEWRIQERGRRQVADGDYVSNLETEFPVG